MDTDRLTRWLTLLANIGVIAGIVVLAFEIKQSNRIAIASTEIEVRNSFDDINESIFSDPNLTELLVRLSDVDAQVTPEEDYRIYAFVLSVINTWLGIEVAYANGLVPASTYNVIEDDIRGFLFSLPGMHPYFQRGYDSYPAQRDTEVYRALERVLREQDGSVN